MSCVSCLKGNLCSLPKPLWCDIQENVKDLSQISSNISLDTLYLLFFVKHLRRTPQKKEEEEKKRRFLSVCEQGSPIKEVAGLNTGTAPSEISAGKTLVWPWAPAPVIWTHPIAHHSKLSCGQIAGRQINWRKRNADTCRHTACRYMPTHIIQFKQRVNMIQHINCSDWSIIHKNKVKSI